MPSKMEQEPAACLSPIVETSREYCRCRTTSYSSSWCGTLATETPGGKASMGQHPHPGLLLLPTLKQDHWQGLGLPHPGPLPGSGQLWCVQLHARPEQHDMSGIKQNKRELSTPTRPNLSYKYRLKLAQASMAIVKEFLVTLCPSLNGTLDGRTLRAASPAGQPPAREACDQLALAWTARVLQG